MLMKVESWQLRQRQGQPLDIKIIMSQERIRAWYEHWNGEVFVSFSGGLDSTVLLHVARQMYPEVPAATAHELLYPEIRGFIQQTDNVHMFYPRMPFNKVVQKYGFPVISKTVAMGCDRYRRTKSEVQRQLRLHGGINPTSGKKQQRSIPIKWHHLINAPFRISEKCCQVLKKQPLKSARKKLGAPMLGTLTEESYTRQMDYMRFGCNAFAKKEPISTPMAFWTHDDVWEYIHRFNVPYSRIYDMGYNRTGCFACMFGVHLEDEPNRFQRLRVTHPKLWKYCEAVGIPEVLDYIGVPYDI